MENNMISNRRMNDRLPWWVNAIVQLGVIPSICVFLILIVTGFIQSPATRALEDRAREHRAMILEIRQARWNQIALLRVICLKIAEVDSQDCLRATVPPATNMGDE